MERQPNESRADGLPPNAAEFIRQVVRRMRWRRRARQEIAAELTAHFEDELRDCADAQEREHRALRLIEGFGDAKLLAVLCRRAKRRCRPLWVKVLVRSAQAVGVYIVLLGFYIVWFVNGQPVVKVDYLALLNQMSRPQVAEQDNAWPYYERALALVVGPNPALQEIPAFQYPDYAEHRDFAGLPEDTRQAIGKWLQANGAAWEQFVRAGAKPYFAKAYEPRKDVNEPWLWSVRLPDMVALRDLGRVGVWSSRRRLAQGEVAPALHDCLAVARAGAHWQNCGTLIEQLAGMGLARMAHEEILRIVSRTELTGVELADWQRKVAALYPQGYPPVAVQFERLVFLDVVQHIFTDTGPGGGHLVPAVSAKLLNEGLQEDDWAADSPFLQTTLSLLHAGRDDTVAKAEQIFNRQKELAALSPYEKRSRRASAIDDMLTSLHTQKYALVRALMPALDRPGDVAFQAKALHEATLAVLALERHRREKGSYPAALDEVKAAGYLATLPPDPYAEGTLSYKKTHDGFVLYSFGLNFRDDDGRPGTDRKGRPRMWTDNGDVIFWPAP